MQAEEGGTSALFQRSTDGIGALQATGFMHNGVQGVGSGQGKVTVKTSQSDVAKVLERGEYELHVKKSDGSSGNREDEGQGCIHSDLEQTEVGLGGSLVRRGRRLDSAYTATVTVDSQSRYMIIADRVRRLGVAFRVKIT
jgi:hypothetical protein